MDKNNKESIEKEKRQHIRIEKILNVGIDRKDTSPLSFTNQLIICRFYNTFALKKIRSPLINWLNHSNFGKIDQINKGITKITFSGRQ